MTLPAELLLLVEEILHNIQPGQLTDESIQGLHHVFQKTFIAALDLIDRACVIRYRMPWGRTEYEVRGSTQLYRVFTPDDLAPRRTPAPRTSDASPLYPPRPTRDTFCSCPAFAIYVLQARTQIMCKHLLAVRLAERLNKFVDRTRTEEELLAAAFSALGH